MNNEVADVCKITAVVLGILIVIFGIVKGVQIAQDMDSVLMFFGVLLGTVVSAFLAWLLFYALGELIEQVSLANQNIVAVYDIVDKETGLREKRDAEQTLARGGWTCEKCGTLNEGVSMSCKNCGEYK